MSYPGYNPSGGYPTQGGGGGYPGQQQPGGYPGQQQPGGYPEAALQNGKGEHFTDKCCQLLVSMFDSQHTGSVDIHQFAKLFEYINQWLNIFKTYDRNGSGQIDDQELNQAFSQMGFNFSPNFTKQLTNISKDHKDVSVDEFIVLCITIQRLTEAFRIRDTQQNGTMTIQFEDFLSVVLASTN